MTNETEQLRPELGYFDDPLQTKPKYDPPVNLPCPYCKEPMHHFDVRTIGFMKVPYDPGAEVFMAWDLGFGDAKCKT